MLYYLGKQRVLIVFDDFYIRWTVLDRNLIIALESQNF